MAKVAVIGAGFSGLSAAAYLAAAGHQVQVFEKNETAGGRARQLKTANGYTFDMGPSWYWMPDIFENFFKDFGYSVSDFYELKLLDPSFDIVFDRQERMSIPENYAALRTLFESIEPGSSLQLDKFMEDAAKKYALGMRDFSYLPGLSLAEFADTRLIGPALRLNLFSSFSSHVRKYFSHPKLIALMEFPVLFLGAMPRETPALYSLMNYAGLKLGTWYPLGGFGQVIRSMQELASRNGAEFFFNAPVEKICIENKEATGIIVDGAHLPFDAVLASADYQHVEEMLLPRSEANYPKAYWEKKTFAPSALIYFLGVTKKIDKLNHHSLFFDEDPEQHAKEIYKTPQWPTKPLFYVCCTSRSDSGVAPAGHENLFLLMPVATGLHDNEDLREKYFEIMMNRLEQFADTDIRSFIDFKKSYSVADFKADYHAYQGNAYGLANTLFQTAVWKPKIKNKKIRNLFYAGQLTVPGPGVPPSLISGKIVATALIKHLNIHKHEAVI
jgi:phytoene desaturase